MTTCGANGQIRDQVFLRMTRHVVMLKGRPVAIFRVVSVRNAYLLSRVSASGYDCHTADFEDYQNVKSVQRSSVIFQTVRRSYTSSLRLLRMGWSSMERSQVSLWEGCEPFA